MELIQLADRMEHVHSDIRGELFHLANKMQREGTPVLKLNTVSEPALTFSAKAFLRLLYLTTHSIQQCLLRDICFLFLTNTM